MVPQTRVTGCIFTNRGLQCRNNFLRCSERAMHLTYCYPSDLRWWWRMLHKSQSSRQWCILYMLYCPPFHTWTAWYPDRNRSCVHQRRRRELTEKWWWKTGKPAKNFGIQVLIRWLYIPPTIAKLSWQVAIVVKTSQLNVYDCWLCTQGHFWLVLTVILTTLNSTRQCFYQSEMVNSFWPVNVLTTRKVWQCLTFKCTSYTLCDFDPCSHRRDIGTEFVSLLHNISKSSFKEIKTTLLGAVYHRLYVLKKFWKSKISGPYGGGIV